jgi:hypothetical protein
MFEQKIEINKHFIIKAGLQDIDHSFNLIINRI